MNSDLDTVATRRRRNPLWPEALKREVFPHRLGRMVKGGAAGRLPAQFEPALPPALHHVQRRKQRANDEIYFGLNGR